MELNKKTDSLIRWLMGLTLTLFTLLTVVSLRWAILVGVTAGIVCILRIYCLSNLRVSNAKLFYVHAFVVDLGLVLWAPSKLWSKALELDSIAVFAFVSVAIPVAILYMLGIVFSGKFKRASSNYYIHYYPSVKEPLIAVFYVSTIAVAFLFSVMSHHYGLERMGVDSNALPFGLNGVIVYYKRIFFPMAVLLLMSILFDRKSYRAFVVLLVLFFIFNVLESYVRFSKGQIVQYFVVPIFFWILFRGFVRLRWCFFIAPAILFFLFSLPYLNAFRFVANSSVTDSQDVKFLIQKNVGDIPSRFSFMVARVFRDYYFIDIYSRYSKVNFATSKVGEVSEYGSPALYFTYAVLGADPNKRTFSAGMSLLGEGYVYFGVLGVVVSLLVLFAVIYWVDTGQMPLYKDIPCGYPILSFCIFTFYFGGFWGFFFRGLPIFIWVLSLVFFGVASTLIYRRVPVRF